jgi:hypothetical protein
LIRVVATGSNEIVLGWLEALAHSTWTLPAGTQAEPFQ